MAPGPPCTHSRLTEYVLSCRCVVILNTHSPSSAFGTPDGENYFLLLPTGGGGGYTESHKLIRATAGTAGAVRGPVELLNPESPKFYTHDTLVRGK